MAVGLHSSEAKVSCYLQSIAGYFRQIKSSMIFGDGSSLLTYEYVKRGKTKPMHEVMKDIVFFFFFLINFEQHSAFKLIVNY